ncbi:MAG: 2-amino-4-hydroxy-6-hydroxymethyldihydropteridine diphosphokinase [Lysobacterales bacterium]|jgi:2-amino-4-hydroxy-6-hydroxymethyldihydropteridine diphosphokinase
MSTAYLGLGSNIDAETNIRSGIDELQQLFRHVSLSPVYRSPAVGFEGNDFINLVARIETDMHPLELKRVLHELEDRHGRDRNSPKFSDRTLDIDILLYDDLYLLSPALEIPRREILTSAHVLKPLADLAPELEHPVCRRSFARLWDDFGGPGNELTRVTL